MKKLLAMALTLCMVLSLCACGASTPAPSAPAASAPAASAPATEAAPTEEAKTYNVGICQLVQHDALDAATQGFMDALKDQLGDAVSFDLQNAQGDSTTCSTIVTGFVSNNVDLIMANATPALQAAVAATTEIPILGTSVTDYATALESDMDAAKGTGINVSGTSDGVPGVLYADLVLQIVPDAKKVAVLYCSAEANSVIQSKDFIDAMAAKDSSIVCTEYMFTDSNDMQAVVTQAAEENDVIYIPTDNTAASNMTIVSNVCVPASMPVICGEENMCKAGGLATVSISYYNIGYVCGQMAADILVNGADVSTMPIGYADAPVLKYNKTIAEGIGCAFDFAGAGFEALD